MAAKIWFSGLLGPVSSALLWVPFFLFPVGLIVPLYYVALHDQAACRKDENGSKPEPAPEEADVRRKRGRCFARLRLV